MDLQKVGALLRELRKEKGLTQEAWAERMGVSNRTVSRWENGNNLPDLDILMEIADDFGIELRQLLNGERKSERMENKETILKAAEYMGEQQEKQNRGVHWLLVAGAVLWAPAQMVEHTPLAQVAGLTQVAAFGEGAAIGALLCGILATSKYGQRLRAFKQRLRRRSA